MKIKKICILVLLCLYSIVPIQADVNKSILILSKQLPYILYVEVRDARHMRVNFIPTKMGIPISCHSELNTSLFKIDVYKEQTCIKKSVPAFFSKKASHMVYVHLDEIASTLKLPYASIDFTKIGNITDYFAKVVKKLKPSMLLHYSDYIESDLNVKDYYDYYTMFNGKKVDITYAYVNLVYTQEDVLPLDNRFHKNKS